MMNLKVYRWFTKWWLFVFCCSVQWAMAGQADLFESFYNDNSMATCNYVTLNIPQQHTLHSADDQDWFVFPAQEGLSYSVKVESVGGDIDPVLDLYLQGINETPYTVDYGIKGENELHTVLRWPQSGYWFGCIRNADWSDGQTSYTLTVALNAGANLGLATISGIKVSSANSVGGRLQLPDIISVGDGITTAPLYSQSSLVYDDGTFASENLPMLLLSGLGDGVHYLDSPWLKRWAELFPGNLTLTRVAMNPLVETHKPMTLSIQMCGTPVVVDLSDTDPAWKDITLKDLEPVAQAGNFIIYRWDENAQDWVVYDRNPTVEWIEGDCLVSTTLKDMTWSFLSNSELFAAVRGSGNAAFNGLWNSYK